MDIQTCHFKIPITKAQLGQALETRRWRKNKLHYYSWLFIAFDVTCTFKDRGSVFSTATRISSVRPEAHLFLSVKEKKRNGDI